MFQAHIFFKCMAASIINSSIPIRSKIRYFRWFSIIRHIRSINIFQNAWKCTISTFSAEINNRKSCRQMRCSSSIYTKMRFRAYSAPSDSLAAGWEPPPQNPIPLARPYGPWVFGPWPQRSCGPLHKTLLCDAVWQYLTPLKKLLVASVRHLMDQAMQNHQSILVACHTLHP